MLTYSDISPRKKAFIFELDNVLYPERDYLLQVYYLFASFIEYIETVPAADDLTAFLKNVYEHHGTLEIFDKAQATFRIDEKYRENFERLHVSARLPLKLLLFDKMLKLLQDIIVDRKKIFIVTDGNPEQQLNKIRQMEWNGLESYLTVYFADEIQAKPETGTIDRILSDHQLLRKDLVIIGSTETDRQFAENSGIDFIYKDDFSS